MADTEFIREVKERDFTTMSNTHLRDITLSMAAKGLFSYILSLPDDWKIFMNELEKHFTTTTYEIRKVVKELEDHGYITRGKKKDENGKFTGWFFKVHETPVITDMRNTEVGKTENPKNRKSGNRTLLNTNNKQITNNTNYLNSNSHCDETSDTTSSVNDSSSVANTPSSESLSNEGAVSENTECTSSPTISEDSLSQTSNTFSTSTITQTPKEKESVPVKEKEKVSPRDVVAHYSERWEIMRERGHVNTDCPPQSYPMIGKLIKSSGATLEQLQKVIDEGFKHPDPIILNSGYPLKTMLSSWWVNKVLNGSLEDPNKNRYSKQPASPNKLNKNAKYSEENWKHEKL